MKKIFPLLLILTLISPHASAATKPITAQVGSIYSAPAGSEGFIQSGKYSLYYQNINQKSADILLTARDLANQQVWQKTIDSGLDEVATAASLDAAGNLWIAGAASITATPESYTPILGIDNPDMVIVETGTALRSDMNQIALWKIAPTGEILASYYSQQSATPLVTAISVASSGISLIGEVAGKQFYITSTLTGTFSKPIFIGTSKTQLTSVIRNSDSSAYIIGNSSETLAGKKVMGVRDGIAFKISKTGAISSLLRSSALKATRSWNSLDPTLLLTGPVVTGKVIETAITKFTPTFTPTWTLRIPSTGSSIGVSGGGNYYLALTSRSAIAGISNWKPTSPSMVVLTFNSKGVITAAHTFAGLVTPLSLQFTRERGVIGLASGSDGLVSIFTLASR